MRLRGPMLVAALLAVTIPGVAQARTALDRDLEGYAIASCLIVSGDARMKDEGDAWASAIVQRSPGGIEPFTAVARVVQAEVGRRGIGRIRVETPTAATDKAVPLLTCHDLIDAPPVARALGTARLQMRRDYARR